MQTFEWGDFAYTQMRTFGLLYFVWHPSQIVTLVRTQGNIRKF